MVAELRPRLMLPRSVSSRHSRTTDAGGASAAAPRRAASRLLGADLRERGVQPDAAAESRERARIQLEKLEEGVERARICETQRACQLEPEPRIVGRVAHQEDRRPTDGATPRQPGTDGCAADATALVLREYGNRRQLGSGGSGPIRFDRDRREEDVPDDGVVGFRDHGELWFCRTSQGVDEIGFEPIVERGFND
jgi:hypothetical protein